MAGFPPALFCFSSLSVSLSLSFSGLLTSDGGTTPWTSVFIS